VFTTEASLWSANRLYTFPTLLIKAVTVATGGIVDATVDRTISSVTTRDATYSSAVATDYTRGVTSGPVAAACESESLAFDWKTTAGLNNGTKLFSSQSISPKNVDQRASQKSTYPISINFTTATAIPENGEITLTLDSTWAFSASTVCSFTGLSATSAATPVQPTPTTPTSGQAFTITTFGAVAASSSITIDCTYVLSTTTSNNSIDLVASLITYDATGASKNEINKWNVADTNVDVTVATITSAAGSSSDWTTTFTPNNASAGVSDAHLKFKVSLELPKGSKIMITFPQNLTNAHSSGTIQDSCYSKIRYQKCEIASSKLELTVDEDVSAQN
jgi:hypothetical protein